MRTWLPVLLLAVSGCSLHVSSDEARFARSEAALDGKADAARTDGNFRAQQAQIEQLDGRLKKLEAKGEPK